VRLRTARIFQALATTVHGFIEAKSWFVNLTTVYVS
jgi:hypothetical protein